MVVPSAIEAEKKVAVVPQPTEPQTPQKPLESFYFVIGTFEIRENAQQFYDAVRKKGLAVEMRESKPGEEPHYFYIHMPQHKTTEVTLEKILELQKSSGIKDAWFKKLD